MKTKIFLSIIFGAILFVFFTQFNFYSKTYLSITTDDRVSEYKLDLTDTQNNTQTFSQKPPSDYPFFYIFNEYYTDTFRSLIGYFTAYFYLPSDTTFNFAKIVLQSDSSIQIKKVCLHNNSSQELCWNTSDVPQIFDIQTSPQEVTLKYKGNFQILQQQFLIPNYPKNIVITLVLLGLIVGIYLFGKQLTFLTQPQVMFFWLGASFGILTSFINPLIKVPDEPYHLSQAVQLTEISGNSLIDQCAKFPANAIISIAELHWHYLHKNSFLLPKDSFSYFSQLPLHSQFSSEMKYTKHYFLFPYLPSAIGIYLGKILDFSWFETIHLMRVINLFVWLFFTYVAISLIPFGKWLLTLIALSPMSLSQAASVSVDGLTNSLSFLLIALILKFVMEERKQILLLVIIITSVFLALAKFPYLILISLLFLILTQQPQKLNRYLPMILGLILITMITLGSALFLGKNLTGIFGIASEQILGIFQNPSYYLGLVFETIKREGLNLVSGWVGIFGWLEIRLPNWFIVLNIMMLALYAITDLNYKNVFNPLSKLFILIIFLLGVLVIFTVLYIIETPLVKLSYIIGLQGRYFIPLGILPFLLLQNKRFSFSNNTLSILSMIYIPFSLIFMLISIYGYYH